jgi:hypothetical protein
MVMGAIAASCAAFLCTVITIDILTLPFALVSVCLILACTAIVSSALLNFLLAGYCIRDVWQLMTGLDAICDAEASYEANRTKEVGDYGDDDDGQAEAIIDFVCNDKTIVKIFATLAAILWVMAGLCVVNIPQPTPEGYSTLLDFASNVSTYTDMCRGCCRTFSFAYVLLCVGFVSDGVGAFPCTFLLCHEHSHFFRLLGTI